LNKGALEMNEWIPDSEERRFVQEVLKLIDSFDELGQNPLAGLDIVSLKRVERGLPDTPRGRGLALQYVLEDVLEELKPEEGEPAYGLKRWRPYIIVWNRFWRLKTPGEICDTLGIADSTYAHEQTRAIDAFARILWRKNTEIRGGWQSTIGLAYHIPPKPPYFVGRKKELSEVSQALEQQVPLVVYGPAGVGKSTLLAKFVNEPEVQEACPDGIHWFDVDRFPLSTICDMIARDLDDENVLQVYTAEEKVAALRAVLTNKETLIVLDEAELEEPIFHFCRHISHKVLVGTRQRFFIPGAISVELLPPPIEEAVKQFRYHANIPTGQDETIREICELLGSMPLAVCLAASTILIEGIFAPELLERLKDDERPLNSLNRNPSGHKDLSVRMSFSVSYDLLPNQSKHVFAVGSVFAAEGAALPAYVAACEFDEIACQRHLGKNVQLSLMKRTGLGRYEFHPLLRMYAEEKLNDGPERIRNVAYQNMAQYFLSYAAKDHEDEMALALEHNNISVAIDWCHEQREWEMFIDYVDSMEGFWTEFRFQEQLQNRLVQAVTACQELGNKAKEADFLIRLAQAYSKNKNLLGKARESLEKALAIQQVRGDPVSVAETLSQLTIIYRLQGDFNSAYDIEKDCLAILREQGDKKALVKHLVDWAGIRRADAVKILVDDLEESERDIRRYGSGIDGIIISFDTAVEYYRQALSLADELEAPEILTRCLTMYAELYPLLRVCLSKKEAKRVTQDIEKGLTRLHELGNWEAQYDVVTSLALTCLAHRDFKGAQRYFERAFAISRDWDYPFRDFGCFFLAGQMHLSRNDFRAARTYYEKHLALERELASDFGVMISLLGLSCAHFSKGNKAVASQYLEEGLTLIQDLDDSEMLGALLLSLVWELVTFNELPESTYAELRLCVLRRAGEMLGVRSEFDEGVNLVEIVASYLDLWRLRISVHDADAVSVQQVGPSLITLYSRAFEGSGGRDVSMIARTLQALGEEEIIEGQAQEFEKGRPKHPFLPFIEHDLYGLSGFASLLFRALRLRHKLKKLRSG
jgi:tetratricopeptide (TPR) repeat protein